MAKSTRTIGYSLNGVLSMDEGTITKYNKEGEIEAVYPVTDYLASMDGKEITIAFKETSELESID